MRRVIKFAFVASIMGLGSVPAMAQGASTVTWDPVYSASCRDCKLSGMRLAEAS